MSDPEQVRKRIEKRIAEIAASPKNTTVEDIEWVVNQLAAFFEVHVRDTPHGKLFRVGERLFSVCTHNPGNRQVKACYVKDFLEAMIDISFYEG